MKNVRNVLIPVTGIYRYQSHYYWQGQDEKRIQSFGQKTYTQATTLKSLGYVGE